MGNVYEYLIDGVSGLAPSGMDGAAMAVGECTKGEPGEAYLLGPRSDVADTLGTGELATLVKDMLATGGQNCKVIAVRVAQEIAGYDKDPDSTMTGPDIEFNYNSSLKYSGADVKITLAQSATVSGGSCQTNWTITVGSGSEAQQYLKRVSNGQISDEHFGVLTIPNGSYTAGDCVFVAMWLAQEEGLTAEDYLNCISSALEKYEVEFVAVAGATGATDWQAYQAKAEEMWNLHRPIYFKCAARLPNDGESLSAWATSIKTARAQLALRWVQVCAQFGDVTDSSGQTAARNWLGLQAGRTMSNPVQRAAGRVKDGPISQGSLPAEWSDAIQSTLEEAGFLTAKIYPGLDGCYWGDSRTLAASTSDFQYEEVVRVVFKAMRLVRQAALNSMYDELGDPALENNPAGLAMLQANIENNLNTMVNAIPKEMAGFKVEIPAGQDFVNNGVAVEVILIGIPIIRQIKIYGQYVYAGSAQDPRME